MSTNPSPNNPYTPHYSPESRESIEASNEPILLEVDYPMSLRDDDLATTYVDTEGTTYLHPSIKYDFGLSTELEKAGLSSGEVVSYNEKPIAVKYSPESDLVILPAIFNASVDLEQGKEDIVEALVKAGQLVQDIKKKCGFVPKDMDMDVIAIDRSRGTAELLIPFKVDSQLSPKQCFESLKQDAFNRIVNQSHAPIVNACFDAASRTLGWES